VEGPSPDPSPSGKGTPHASPLASLSLLDPLLSPVRIPARFTPLTTIQTGRWSTGVLHVLREVIAVWTKHDTWWRRRALTAVATTVGARNTRSVIGARFIVAREHRQNLSHSQSTVLSNSSQFEMGAIKYVGLESAG